MIYLLEFTSRFSSSCPYHQAPNSPSSPPTMALLLALIDKVEGFYYPGFINVDSIRVVETGTNRSNVCWEKAGKIKINQNN